MTADEVAQELERAWVEDIKVGEEIHLITRSENEVVLEFVMVESVSGIYQTGEIVVDMANPGPIQRRTKAGKHRAG